MVHADGLMVHLKPGVSEPFVAAYPGRSVWEVSVGAIAREEELTGGMEENWR